MDVSSGLGAIASAVAIWLGGNELYKWNARRGQRRQPLVVEHVAYGGFEEPFDFVLRIRPSDKLRLTLEAPAVDLVSLRGEVAALGGREVSYLGRSEHSPLGLGTVTRVHVTLRGRSGSTLITSVRARLVEVSAAWQRAIIHTASQGANMAEAVAFDLNGQDLNARALTLADHVDAVAIAPKYLQGRQVTLDEGELLSFDILAVMQHSSARWVVDVRTADGSILTVDDNGLPFSTSARATVYEEAWTRNFSSSRALTYRACVWPDCQPLQGP